MQKIIGMITTYEGQEHRYMTGHKVRIVAVIKENSYLDDDLDIERAGGVSIHDRIEVQPWIENEGRFSWVTSDPRVVDLKCFSR